MRDVLAPLSGEVLGFSNIKPVQGPSPGGFLIFTFTRTGPRLRGAGLLEVQIKGPPRDVLASPVRKGGAEGPWELVDMALCLCKAGSPADWVRDTHD